jgi:hypothetical protein
MSVRRDGFAGLDDAAAYNGILPDDDSVSQCRGTNDDGAIGNLDVFAQFHRAMHAHLRFRASGSPRSALDVRPGMQPFNHTQHGIERRGMPTDCRITQPFDTFAGPPHPRRQTFNEALEADLAAHQA